LLVNPDVIFGHVPISEPLFEFAAAARTTDLLNFPHRFHRDHSDERVSAFLELEQKLR
jgi:phage terminase large subunit-like protein